MNPVSLEDDGRFQCQVGAAEGVAPIRSRYATLTVLVPPEAPEIFPQGDYLRTVEGNEVELRCESRLGKPASEVSSYFYSKPFSVISNYIVSYTLVNREIFVHA